MFRLGGPGVPPLRVRTQQIGAGPLIDRRPYVARNITLWGALNRLASRNGEVLPASPHIISLVPACQVTVFSDSEPMGEAMDRNRMLIIAAAVVVALVLAWYLVPAPTPTEEPPATPPPATAPQPQ